MDPRFKLSQERRAAHRQHHHRALQAAVQHSVSASMAGEARVLFPCHMLQLLLRHRAGGQGGGQRRIRVSGSNLAGLLGRYLTHTLFVDTQSIHNLHIIYTIYTLSTHYLRQVWVYSLTGLVEELPNMIEKRFTHGCGHYVNTDNEPASP